MSINSNMKPYTLKKYTHLLDDNDDPRYSSLGEPIFDYVEVESIDVSVNYANSTIIIDGIFYKKVLPSGITDYTEFDLKENYRLEGNGHIYNIEGINPGGRKTALSLKEVFI